MIHALIRSFQAPALLAVTLGLAACSSSTTTPAVSDAGTTAPTDAGGSPGADAGTDTKGGFDFVFSSNMGATTRTDFRVGGVQGSMCMGAAPNRVCTFTGSITANGCTSILNVAFVGTPAAGASFPLVSSVPTPANSGLVSYTEVCGADSKTWRATAGTMRIDSVMPPAAGLAMGTASFTVTGATMAVAPEGAGTAQGTFTAAGSTNQIIYTGP